MKNIYLLYSCDQWKGWNSMQLIMASITEDKIRKEIKLQIKENNMEYGANKKDILEQNLNYLNISLEYGYVEIVIDGERQ